MQSKTSSFNRGMWIQSVRNVGWVGALYTLVLLFIVPLQIILRYTGEVNKDGMYTEKLKTLFEVAESLQFLFMFTVPVVLAIFLFRYIQTKSAADYIHRLPISRGVLFWQNVLLGIVSIVLPVIISAIVLFLIKDSVNVEDLYTLKLILHWAINTIVLNIFVFSGAVFAGMFTGMSILQGAFVYILFILPAALIQFFIMNINFYWYGFATNYYSGQNIQNLVPFVRIIDLLDTGKESYLSLVIYAVVACVLCFIACIAYQKRSLEIATHAIAFKWLKPIFIYGLTTCSLLLWGMYFGEMKDSFKWLIFGYVFGSLLGYILGHMILAKTWRVFRKWKGYILFVAVAIVIGVGLKVDVFGYSTYLPNQENIQSVYFGEDGYSLTDNSKSHDIEQGDYYKPPYYYSSKNTINFIRVLHKQIIKDHPNISKREMQSGEAREITFAYNLKNGKKVVRQYRVREADYKAFYKRIIETPEYKNHSYYILEPHNKNMRYVTEVQIDAMYKKSEPITIKDPNKIESLKGAIRTSIQNQTYEDTKSRQQSWSSIDFMDENGQIVDSIPFEKSYKGVEKWLKQEKMFENARIMPEDVSNVVVLKNKDHETLQPSWINNPSILTKRKGALTIKDSKQIDYFLSHTTIQEQGDYIVVFRYKNSSPEVQMFDANMIPTKLKEKLK
ncbi:multidrug ABC transporter permease [Bacillus megaterium]|nr:multidrug ABC transporter permease [Priestia megaterium]